MSALKQCTHSYWGLIHWHTWTWNSECQPGAKQTRSGKEPGDNELSSTTKVNGRARIRTSDHRYTNCQMHLIPVWNKRTFALNPRNWFNLIPYKVRKLLYWGKSDRHAGMFGMIPWSSKVGSNFHPRLTSWDCMSLRDSGSQYSGCSK